jgi:TonB-dependent Receptor Plug Domain
MDLYGKITDPLIVLDGVPMPEHSIGLDQISPADIDFIEILRGAEASIYGIKGGAGVISINTRRGPDYTSYGNSNLRIISPVMYHVSPSFEMPDYSNDLVKNNLNPDPRTTIYWNSNIATDANGEAAINFYTADNATNYTVTVTGLTANGELVYKRVVISNTGKSR